MFNVTAIKKTLYRTWNAKTSSIVSKIFPLAFVGVLFTACSHSASVPGSTGALTPLKQLSAMDWRLTGIKKGLAGPTSHFKSGVPTRRYSLRFTGGSMQLSGGCNVVNGVVKIRGAGKMQMGPLMMTNRGCNRKLMQADAEIGNTLGQVSHYRLRHNELALLGARNILVFKGTPTPETTYGSKGQRKFIEIRNASSGLQWREAKYDARWVRTNKNASWNAKSFPGIRGFTPQPNYEYIVRIKEFRRSNNSKPVWIKDSVTSQGVLN